MMNLRVMSASAAIAIAAIIGAGSRAEAAVYTFNDPGWVSGSVIQARAWFY